MKKNPLVPWIGFAVVCLAVALQAEKIKVQSDADPAFDFATVRTWDWDPQGVGDVLVARTATDDPAPVKKRVEPLIQRFVGAEMAKRGLTPATGTPDLRLHYYVLVSLGFNAQEMGQFLPPVLNWGLPPFAPQTTATTVVTRGSLVLDAMLPDTRKVVWRAIAQTVVKDDDSQKVREERIQSAAYELVKRLPKEKVKAKKKDSEV